MKDNNLAEKIGWNTIDHDIQELLRESQKLINTANKWEEEFHDYAFIVFPAAKAYEGYLKHLFLKMGFHTQEDYDGKRFRIGKALNPSLEKHLRENESVYDKIVNFCNDETLADKLWEVWKNSRNMIFHWFPNEKNSISYDEAVDRVGQIIAAFDMAHKECRID